MCNRSGCLIIVFLDATTDAVLMLWCLQKANEGAKELALPGCLVMGAQCNTTSLPSLQTAVIFLSEGLRGPLCVI